MDGGWNLRMVKYMITNFECRARVFSTSTTVRLKVLVNASSIRRAGQNQIPDRKIRPNPRSPRRLLLGYWEVPLTYPSPPSPGKNETNPNFRPFIRTQTSRKALE